MLVLLISKTDIGRTDYEKRLPDLVKIVKDVVLEAFEAFSRIKRNYAHQRQAEGIAVAKVNDVTFELRAMPVPEKYPIFAEMYRNNQISARGAAKQLNVAPGAFLKWYRNESI